MQQHSRGARSSAMEAHQQPMPAPHRTSIPKVREVLPMNLDRRLSVLGGDMPEHTLLDRYDHAMKLAEDFRHIVEAVFDHPQLPAPDGMRPSQMSWTKQVGNTKHMAWITRLAAEVEGVIFTIAHWTPDMHAGLINYGKQTFDVTLSEARHPTLDDVLSRFARHWLEVSGHDLAPNAQ
jgi:hypothetical protein